MQAVIAAKRGAALRRANARRWRAFTSGWFCAIRPAELACALALGVRFAALIEAFLRASYFRICKGDTYSVPCACPCSRVLIACLQRGSLSFLYFRLVLRDMLGGTVTCLYFRAIMSDTGIKPPMVRVLLWQLNRVAKALESGKRPREYTQPEPKPEKEPKQPKPPRLSRSEAHRQEWARRDPKAVQAQMARMRALRGDRKAGVSLTPAPDRTPQQRQRQAKFRQSLA